MKCSIHISGDHYKTIQRHLYPGDELEAVAVALCGRHCNGSITQLLVQDVTFIPHGECERFRGLLKWKTDRIHPYFEKVMKHDSAILKIHSHPGGFADFSPTDDVADAELFESVFGWSDTDNVHASAIMLPDGRIFGRCFQPNLETGPISKVVIAGDTIRIFRHDGDDVLTDEFGLRTAQVFGERTYSMLKGLTVGVVGGSGTGCLIIEQLIRLGVGRIVIVDPDFVEEKNLNRIIQATQSDAVNRRTKVDVLASHAMTVGLGTEIVTFDSNIYDSIDAIRSLISCDIVFGCVDSYDGRFLLNQLSTFYLKPYFDMGVRLDADGNGGIDKICMSSHYFQPGKSSFISRGVFSMDDVVAASLLRRDKEEYERQKKAKYIKNVQVDRPAVVSVNMMAASHAVNDFLNRIHPYKLPEPQMSAWSTIDLTENFIQDVAESDLQPDEYLAKRVGFGEDNCLVVTPAG